MIKVNLPPNGRNFTFKVDNLELMFEIRTS